MPTYEYVCTECSATYDIFHKVREISEDVMCPSCGSINHKRIMSVTSMSMSGGSSHHSEPGPSCSPGSCCGGSCGVN